MRKRFRIAVGVFVFLLIVAVTFFIYDPTFYDWTDLIYLFYFIPIILSAVLLSMRACILASLVASLFYFPIVFFEEVQISPIYSTIKAVAVMVYFNLTGIGVGLLFRRERRQRERYEDLSRELERANRQLKETEEKRRMAALGELAAGVAHEVRTPLNSIRGFAEFLQSDYPSGDPKRKFAEVIVAEAERLEKVVSDFLAFARPSDLHFERTRIEPIIERSLRLVEESARRQGVHIKTDYAPAIPSAIVDAEGMEQVFLNLFTNSIQAMAGGGQLSVKVALDPSEKRMLVQVQDTGVGIKSEEMGKLFEPFFTTKKNGTGLGLPIVKRIVDGHRGGVRVESQPGCGSVFIVSLPTTEDGGGS